MNHSFWAGKKVLVTGHTGFKGSWLCLWLQEAGAEVMGYALEAPTDPSLFESARVAEGMTSILGDVRDAEKVLATVADHRPEIVLHLAAQSLVRESYRDPVGTYATNVMGTVHLLEAVRQTDSVRAFVNVTSDKCYENQEWLWGYREHEAMGGHDPYSNSKGCSELVTAAYRKSFFSSPDSAQVASGRAGNVIGGGDWARDRLVPDIMASIVAGSPVPIRNPDAIRPWQHVLEPLHGYVMLAEALVEQGEAVAEGWNFGPDESQAQPVSTIVDILTTAWGDGARWERDGADHPHEATFLKLDSSKARTRLGWKPQLNLDATLSWIVNWHRGLAAGQDARDLTLADIQRYEGLLQM